MPTIGEPLYVMKNIGPTPLIEDKQPPDAARHSKGAIEQRAQAL